VSDEGPRRRPRRRPCRLSLVRATVFTPSRRQCQPALGGASASVIMSDKEASKRGLKRWYFFRGFVAAGCEPDEWASARCFARAALPQGHGLKIDGHDLWTLNEAFAVQGDLWSATNWASDRKRSTSTAARSRSGIYGHDPGARPHAATL